MRRVNILSIVVVFLFQVSVSSIIEDQLSSSNNPSLETPTLTQEQILEEIGNNKGVRIELKKRDLSDSQMIQVRSRNEMKLNTLAQARNNDERIKLKLENYYNFNYVGQLEIGTPPQKLNVIFDTGSTNSWFLSTLCDSESCHDGSNNAFDPEQSETFEMTDQYAMVQFGSGALEGVFGYDHFHIGGVGQKRDKIIVKDQYFGLVTREQLFDNSFDAIQGLAFPEMAEGSELPLFDTIMKQELLESNVFAFFMSMNEDEQSELVFGWIDSSRYIGELDWHPVRDRLFWSLKLDDVKLNGKKQNLCKNKKCLVTPDSGTSQITFPTWALRKMYKKFPVIENCESTQDLGTLTFVIDGIDYELPSHHYMERVLDLDEKIYCVTSIEALDVMQDGQKNLFIVGDAFMQLYYTIFDRDNDRVGMATAKHKLPEEDLDIIFK